MSFKSYRALPQSDGSLLLQEPQPLRLSGREGLVARFVLRDPQRAAAPWKVSAAEWLALVPGDASVADRILVFEDALDGAVEIQQVSWVHGQSGTRTEMLFTLQSLTIESARAPLRVRPPAMDRTYAEELSLDGGVDALNGTWKWCKAHLALGGVVLQKRPSSKSETILGQSS